MIQSFAPNEVRPEKAMEIAQELCHRLQKEQYQYVIAIHTDHEHIHARMIVNNTNMITGNGELCCGKALLFYKQRCSFQNKILYIRRTLTAYRCAQW